MNSIDTSKSATGTVVGGAVAALIGSLIAATCAEALPLGRAWAPTDTFRLAGHTFLAPMVMEQDSRGAPLLVAEAVGGIGQDAYGLCWADSTWIPTWNLGYGTAIVAPGDAPLDRHPLVWQSVDPKGPNGNLVRLEVAEMFEGYLGPVDTLPALVLGSNSRHAMAVHGNHRWVAKQDFSGDLRMWRSSEPRVWEELPIPGVVGNGLALGAIDDTTVMVVFAWQFEGIRWGYMRGTTWDEQPPLASGNVRGGGHRLRRNAERDYWLGWASDENDMGFKVARFSNDAWGPIIQIDCNYRLPHVYLAKSSSLSRDPSPYPAIAWSAYSTSTGAETVCACVPTDSGFTVADNLENSDGGLPVIVRDLNGDAWVAWWRYFDGMFFTHTYTVATSSAPVVEGAANSRTITWVLSEPAPETWWAVLRAEPGGAFEAVARVRAGHSLELSWSDDLVSTGPLRYRIRRESVDKRYEWLSDEVVWDGATAADLALASAEATPERVTLIWQGTGAGGLDARVERRSESDDWQVLGAAVPESADRLRYEDATVVPGTRYGYRLAYTESGESRHTAESWVEVPARPALALEGFQPNPAREGAVVAFTLPSSGRGRLEVLDVSGRRVFRQTLDGLGAGRHTVDLASGLELAPGVYLIRLTHEGRRVTARGAIVR